MIVIKARYLLQTGDQPPDVSVISDNTSAVVSTVKVGNGAFGVAYDSGKNEIFVTNAADSAVSIISDSTSSPTSTTSATSTVPEFSSVMIVSLAVAMVILGSCTVAFSMRITKRL